MNGIATNGSAPSAPIASCITALGVQIDDLRKAVEDVGVKFCPALSPSLPSPISGSEQVAPAAQKSDIANILDGFSDRINEATNKLRDIERRSEL